MTTKDKENCTGQCSGDGRGPGLFFGGSFIIAGLAFLGGELGWLHGHSPWDFWPALLLWLGLIKIFTRRFGCSLFLIFAGSGLLGWTLGYFPLQWSVIWPAILILLGVVIFASGVFGRRRPAPSSRPFSADFFEAHIVFGGQQREVLSQSFEGGDISCVMGGLELDLRRARLKEKEAVLKIKLTMGGLELKVPETWEVVFKGDPMLGGFENKHRGPSSPETFEGRLILDTTVLMEGSKSGINPRDFDDR